MRQIGDQHALLFGRALPDEAVAKPQVLRMAVHAVVGERREQHEAFGFLALHLIDHALLRVDERRQFGEQHAADGRQIALALQHAGESREVGLQPVLLLVAVGGEAQVVDHRVDVVFQLGHFAARFHLNRAGEVALGDGGCDFGDGAHLVREVVGQ